MIRGLAALAALLGVGVIVCGTLAGDDLDIRGLVRDAETGKAIPYANIGVPQLAVGTVADERGRYRLELPTLEGQALVSALGYVPRGLALDVLSRDGTIRLEPSEIVLTERVVVTAQSGADEDLILGQRYDPVGHGIGFASAQLGAEMATRIKVKHRTLIRSAHFAVSHTRADGFLFRVNLYEFQGRKAGANLLRENVIVSAITSRGVMSVDLEEHGIVAEGDVLLSLEWVRGDEGHEVPPLMFRSRKGGSEPTYMKRTSQAEFVGIDRMRLGFFLIGRRLH